MLIYEKFSKSAEACNLISKYVCGRAYAEWCFKQPQVFCYLLQDTTSYIYGDTENFTNQACAEEIFDAFATWW